MGVQVKLLVLSIFLVLNALSFCEAKKATVKVVGILHSKDSIKNHSTNTNSSLGIGVFINCNEKTKGKGGIDEHGKFNVTLSAEIGEDTSEIDGCYARLQSNSGAPCHIQEPQTASVKVLAAGEKVAVIFDKPTVIKFSPLDCQSAFFWPFPNLTFLGSPPSPPEYTAPPAPAVLPPAENSSPPPQPSYDPPVPSPSRPPSAGTPPAPAPTCQDPIKSPSPPPAYTDPATPAAKSPALAPPPAYTDPATPATKTPSPPPQAAAPPLPAYKNPSPAPSTAYNKPSPSPPALPPLDPTPAMSSNPPPSATIPSRRRPSPIPRAPPIPRLPVTPSVPRKYFNPPNSSKSKPPRLV